MHASVLIRRIFASLGEGDCFCILLIAWIVVETIQAPAVSGCSEAAPWTTFSEVTSERDSGARRSLNVILNDLFSKLFSTILVI